MGHLSVKKQNANIISDEELVEQSLRGEEDAFRQLYERYRLAVYAAVYRVILDSEEALDVTQEVFITVFRSLAIWNPQRAGFLPWIYRMATNRAIDYWRLRRRRAEVPLTETSKIKSNGTEFCSGTLEPIERTVEYKELAAEMGHILEMLPLQHRRFIVLRYCDGLKLKEIAEKENCKLGTVKSVLHRGTNVIRFKLKRLSKQLYANSRDLPVQNLALELYGN